MPSSSLEEFVGTMTVRELSERSGKSIEQLVAWALGGAAASPGARKPARSADPEPTGRGGSGRRAVNTKTAAGRAAFDAAVLESLNAANAPTGASKLRKKVGGTGLQMRTALNRLIDAGKVRYQGRARATKYAAT